MFQSSLKTSFHLQRLQKRHRSAPYQLARISSLKITCSTNLLNLSQQEDQKAPGSNPTFLPTRGTREEILVALEMPNLDLRSPFQLPMRIQDQLETVLFLSMILHLHPPFLQEFKTFWPKFQLHHLIKHLLNLNLSMKLMSLRSQKSPHLFLQLHSLDQFPGSNPTSLLPDRTSSTTTTTGTKLVRGQLQSKHSALSLVQLRTSQSLMARLKMAHAVTRSSVLLQRLPMEENLGSSQTSRPFTGTSLCQTGVTGSRVRLSLNETS